MILKSPHSRNIGKAGKKVLVMGILNLTPDSFSDGGSFTTPDLALRRAADIVGQGADIIDMGAESTRPDCVKISEQEELDRLMPSLKAVRKEFPDIPISIDTYKSKVAMAAIEAGADMINDVLGARYEMASDGASSPMAVVAAQTKAPIVLMHNCFDSPIAERENILEKISDSLKDSARLCIESGVDKNAIVLDPGFGFGKSAAQNLEILKNMGMLKKLGYPILLGLSRKRTLGAITGRPPHERDDETAFANLYAIFSGSADIIRVHNVEKNVIALKIFEAINSPEKWIL